MDRILGITAEYDPFHKGHAYQLTRAREQVQPEAVVCVMSGDFTQRGEPAVLDKWTRARIAVQQGADLVFELPFIYACNRAERFASGAVDLLIAAEATHISFGCEAEDPEELMSLAKEQISKDDQLKEMTAEHMKDGCSRAKASELASRQLLGDELTDLMLEPNNILALEYMKRILWWKNTAGVNVRSVPIRRYGSDYSEENPEAGYAGGTAIRQMLAAGQDIRGYLPYETKELSWVDLVGARQKLYDHIRSIVLRSTPEHLAQIYCVGEGMEHRLIKEVRRQERFDDFLSAMTSRRYSSAAIRRIMLYILMCIDEMPVCEPYGKVLAASDAGRRQLRHLADSRSAEELPQKDSTSFCMKKDLDKEPEPLTVIANTNKLEEVPEPIREALRLDSLAADMFHLICGRSVDEEGDGRRRPWIGPAGENR